MRGELAPFVGNERENINRNKFKIIDIRRKIMKLNKKKVFKCFAVMAAAMTMGTTVIGMTACDALGGGDTLVVYTNSGSGGRAKWWEKEAKEAGFNITVVDGGADKMKEKIIAEAKNPQADVMCGLNTMGWSDLKARGLIEQYVPKWADHVDEGLNDPDGYYHAITKETILLIYDKEVMGEGENKLAPPSDWIDIWNPANTQYHGKFQCWSSLGGGTTQVVLSSIMHRYKSDASDAKYGVSPEGWTQIKNLYTYGVKAQGNVFDALSNKNPDHSNYPICMGQWYSSGIKSYSETYYNKSKTQHLLEGVGYVVPEVGVPYAVTGCGIIKGTKKKETAQKFLDWYGSDEFQTKWAQKWNTAPANNVAWQSASEDAKLYTSLKQQEIDWAWAQSHMGDWIAEIELQYMK